MIYYKCDQTGNTQPFKPNITLSGFNRCNDGGILLPGGQDKHFIDRQAFIAWAKEALEQEGYKVEKS